MSFESRNRTKANDAGTGARPDLLHEHEVCVLEKGRISDADPETLLYQVEILNNAGTVLETIDGVRSVPEVDYVEGDLVWVARRPQGHPEIMSGGAGGGGNCNDCGTFAE